MKHLTEFYKDSVTERKILKAKLHRDYDVDSDNYLRYVWCDRKESNLTINKKYRLYAEFETGAMISGKCFVVFDNNNNFMGYDSDYFMEEYQWVATKKYNL